MDITIHQAFLPYDEVVQEPADQPYIRDCAFRDPAGDRSRIREPR